ncbi:MAG: hypothetical protein HFH67_11725 [Lachnospiraceae bacterium]|nr:hypothetical protein [Lachnospiraceae bacterium]
MDMGSFKIDGTEFGIGNIKLSLDNGLLNLQVTGDSSVFDRLMDNGGSEWDWALYAPKIYFNNVPYKGGILEIDNSVLNRYDIALYMMEYNDFTGIIEISEGNINIQGNVDLMGKIMPVSITAVNPQ